MILLGNAHSHRLASTPSAMNRGRRTHRHLQRNNRYQVFCLNATGLIFPRSPLSLWWLLVNAVGFIPVCFSIGTILLRNQPDTVETPSSGHETMISSKEKICWQARISKIRFVCLRFCCLNHCNVSPTYPKTTTFWTNTWSPYPKDI